jgi:hypothetical protein
MSETPSVENQLDLQIPEKVGDDLIEFPRLDLDDLMRWANSAKSARLAEAEKRLRADGDVTPFERQRHLQIVADDGLQLGLLMARSFEPAGIRTVLVTSLKKAKKSDAEALAILKRIHFRRQQQLAQEVLSPPAPPKAEKKGGGSEGFTESETGDYTAALARVHAGCDLMAMTWATAEDFITRLMPYLVRVNAGVPVDDAMRESVEKPFPKKRGKTK